MRGAEGGASAPVSGDEQRIHSQRPDLKISSSKQIVINVTTVTGVSGIITAATASRIFSRDQAPQSENAWIIYFKNQEHRFKEVRKKYIQISSLFLYC